MFDWNAYWEKISEKRSCPQNHRVEPFRIMDNLYYIGDDDGGSHLIDTGEGLIVIDTSFPQTQALLIESIWELGFDPRDIVAILHTHGHYDHFGATNLLVKLSGAKTYLSEVDAKMFQERPELAICTDSREMFVPDVLIHDGDEIHIGNVKIRTVAVPGHTEGAMAFFGTVHDDNGQEYIWGLHGGLGFLTLEDNYIEKHHLPDLCSAFERNLRKMMEEEVDIVLGNHVKYNHTLEKRAKMLANPNGDNPFIDKGEWKSFLEETLKSFRKWKEEERS